MKADFEWKMRDYRLFQEKSAIFELYDRKIAVTNTNASLHFLK